MNSLPPLHSSLSVGLEPTALFASLVYAFFGLLLMIVFISLIDKIFNLHFRKELLEDQNMALGILFAGISIALSIIIASAIH